MSEIVNDEEYISLVRDILYHPEFRKLESIPHHDTNRFEHSVRVSYHAYNVAKKLRLDYIEVARGGLLHDFYICEENRSGKKKAKETFTHPEFAYLQAGALFKLSDKEEDIIRCHMFPVVPKRIPKYAESWVVSTSDKIIGVPEMFRLTRGKLSYGMNLVLLFMLFTISK